MVAPCALGGAVDEITVGRLRCQVLCGAANNQLVHDGLAEDLEAHGVLYGPDFIANAGGLINIAVELEGYEPAARAAAGLGDRRHDGRGAGARAGGQADHRGRGARPRPRTPPGLTRGDTLAL